MINRVGYFDFELVIYDEIQDYRSKSNMLQNDGIIDNFDNPFVLRKTVGGASINFLDGLSTIFDMNLVYNHELTEYN